MMPEFFRTAASILAAIIEQKVRAQSGIVANAMLVAGETEETEEAAAAE